MAGFDSHVLIGFGMMAIACATAAWIGDRLSRRAALIIAVVWSVSTVAQFALGRTAEPAILADVFSGLGLLTLAAFESAFWLWGIVGIEVALLLVHAMLYRSGGSAWATERLFNNGLTSAALLLLLGGAVWSWRHRINNYSL